MKKATIILLIVAGAVFTAGITCLVIAGALTGFHYGNLYSTRNYEKIETDIELADGDNLTVILATSDLNVRIAPFPTTDNTVHIVYYEAQDRKFELTHENGEIKLKSLSPSFSLFTIFSVDLSDYAVEIALPESFNGKVSLSSTTGDISVSSLDIPDKTLELNATTGHISLENATAYNISVNSSTGHINLENIVSGSDVTARATTGSVTLNGVSAKGKIACESDTGSQRSDKLNAPVVSIATSTGGIRFNDIDAQDVRLRASTGSVSGKLCGSDSEYSIVSSSSTGRNNLPESWGKGERKLNVRTSTGDIKITFED